jgi:hypothetical protein
MRALELNAWERVLEERFLEEQVLRKSVLWKRMARKFGLSR